MTYSNSETRLRTRPNAAPASEQSSRKGGAHETVRVPRPQVGEPGRMHVRRAKLAAALLAATVAGLTVASAQSSYALNLTAPTMDKWMYPFGFGGGTKTPASTFAAIGSAGFDDRDAQFFNAFNTNGIVPAGQGSANYQILSATFTLAIAREEGTAGFVFDGTYDPITTYGPHGEPINGDDAGRPIELYGAGYRNGLTSSTILENTPFTTAPALAEGTRTIFATDFQLGTSINGQSRDVSNNITDAFDPVPFAIGQIAPEHLESDGTAKDDALIVFTLNLANPDVVRYLQLSLDEGCVGFVATSLHMAAQGGPPVYPTFYAKENLVGSMPGQLNMQVQVVPEPSAVTMGLCGFGLFVACWRARRVVAPGTEAMS